jgi:hypothetical protein
VLRRIFGHRRNEVPVGWRNVRNEEFHNLNCSPRILMMIKSRKMKWASHVARMDI